MALRETDIHTGLYTSGFLVAFGARELSFAREAGYPVSLLSIGVGSERSASASETLRRVGERVRTEVGDGAIVAKVSDDELAVLLPGIGSEKAGRLGESIKSVLERNEGVFVGVASSPDGDIQFGELLRKSQERMNCARGAGTIS